MDSSVFNLLLALGIDITAFVLLFIGFGFYRRLRSRPVTLPVEGVEIKEPYVSETRYGITEIFDLVNSVQDDDFFKCLGEWGYLYLVLHRYMSQIFYSNLVVGVGLLGIIYIFGTTDGASGLDIVSILHVIDDDFFLLVPAICIAIFSFVIYYYIYAFYKETNESDFSKIASLPQDYTVYFTNLPRDLAPNDLNEKLFNWLRENYGKGVLHVITVPNYKKAFEHYRDYQELSLNLKFYLHELDTKQKRPRIWIFDYGIKRVDAIDHTRKELFRLYDLIQCELDLSKNSNCGAVFVICSNKALARELAEPYIAKNDELESEKWKKRMAPASKDIMWENIGLTGRDTIIQRLIFNALFIVIFLVFFTPTSFEIYIEEVLEMLGVSKDVQDYLSDYLPSLLLLFYQQIILPETVDFLVLLEKHDNQADAINSALRKYLFYLIFFVFLYPLLGLEIWEIFDIIFNADKDWNSTFAESVTEAGDFFILFMVHQCFLKNGLDLLVIAKYIKVKAKSLIAVTSIEKAMAYQADDFRFAFEFAVTINTFIIAASLSIVFPLILIPASIFFFVRFTVHKHNLLCVFYVNRSSSAYSVLFLVLCGLAASAYVMQIVTASAMFLNGSDSYLIFNSFMNCFTIVLFVSLCYVFYSSAGKTRPKNFDDEEEEKSFIEIDPKLYDHPLNSAVLDSHLLETEETDNN